jgi:hypothetical protein
MSLILRGKKKKKKETVEFQDGRKAVVSIYFITGTLLSLFLLNKNFRRPSFWKRFFHWAPTVHIKNQNGVSHA